MFDEKFKERVDSVNEATNWSDVMPNFFKCFSSRCGVQGDKINVYKQLNNLSYGQALRDLEGQHSLDYNSQFEEYLLRNNLLNDILDAYGDQLDKHPEVQDYLYSRGFTKDFIELSKIGYAPNNKILCMYELSRNKLMRHSLANKKGDFFWQRIVFPIYNINGYLVHLTGRSFPVLSEDFKYLDTKAIPVIGSSKNYLLFEEQLNFYKNGSKTLYLVEGVPDSYILKQSGANVVGILGLAKLMSHTSKFEGQLKSWRIVMNQLIDLQLYLGKKIQISTCMIPEGLYLKDKQVKDINDLYLYVNKDEQEMFKVIQDSTIDLVESFIEKYGGDISYHKTALKLIASTDRGQHLMSNYITGDWSALDYAIKVLVN